MPADLEAIIAAGLLDVSDGRRVRQGVGPSYSLVEGGYLLIDPPREPDRGSLPASFEGGHQ
jgi:hypothetical protein